MVLRITGFQFDAVIIDEAGSSKLFFWLRKENSLTTVAQAVEPSTLIPFKYNPHAVVMVGDPCQVIDFRNKCTMTQSIIKKLKPIAASKDIQQSVKGR